MEISTVSLVAGLFGTLAGSVCFWLEHRDPGEAFSPVKSLGALFGGLAGTGAAAFIPALQTDTQVGTVLIAFLLAGAAAYGGKGVRDKVTE
jgi:hypothetical protein